MCVCVCLCHVVCQVCHVRHVRHVYPKSSLTLLQVRHPSPTAEETTLAEASNLHRYPGHTAAASEYLKRPRAGHAPKSFNAKSARPDFNVLQRGATCSNVLPQHRPSQFLAKIGSH